MEGNRSFVDLTHTRLKSGPPDLMDDDDDEAVEDDEDFEIGRAHV